MSKSTSGKTPAESLLGAVSDAINSANYSWTTGAIQRAKCLSINHFSKSEQHPELQIIAAQMNAYYSAIGYFIARGGLYHFVALWYLINARRLANEYLSFLEEKSLRGTNYETVGVLQQCQASYWGWAAMKKKLGLKVKEEMILVVDLYNQIRLHKETNESIVALAAEKIYNFPCFRVDTDLYYMARETIRKEIARLQKIGNSRKAMESQVLSRLLRAVGKHEEAEEVALKAGLPDQAQKAKAGI